MRYYIGATLAFIIFSLCYLIARAVVFSNRDITKKRREFQNRESEANAVRRADISNLAYLTLDLSKLPMTAIQATKRPEQANELASMCDKKILNLSMYTNTDLKLMYGPANLEELSICDENFTSLIRLLNSIADNLLEIEDLVSAKSFLEYAVEVGSDITATYTSLAYIYKESNDQHSLNQLLNKAKEIQSLSGKTIIDKLNSIKSTMK